MGVDSACPRCGAQGRRVGALTLRSLLLAEACDRVGNSAGFRFCPTETCEVVYFEPPPGERFRKIDLTVPVFQKSTDPSRLVCYCFEHSVEAIHNDVARTGAPTIAEVIARMCRQGLDHCEELNPQGSCCLGNVRRLARAALAETMTPGSRKPRTEETTVCCPPRTKR